MNRLALILTIGAVAVLAFQRLPSQEVTRIIEAEQYAELTAPMELVNDKQEASGAGYLQIPPGSGQGWRGNGKGRVTFRFDVPSGGLYVLWARTRWKDGCSNAFFMHWNQQAPIVFGNDAVFNQWHWVPSSALSLQKGVNYLVFSNHSDAVALDKLILTNDRLYMPQGLAEEVTHFFDGFAGCDADNTGSWQFESGKWRVLRNTAGAEAGPADCLAQLAPEGGAAFVGYPVWHDYDVRLKTMVTQQCRLTILFYSTGENDGCRLTCEIDKTGSLFRCETVTNGTVQPLSEPLRQPFLLGAWHDISITDSNNDITCSIDSKEIVKVPLSASRSGRLGLVTSKGGIYFDNVEVTFHRHQHS